MQKQRLTFHYSLTMGLYWSNYAILLNYASVYLLGKGLPNTVIGLLIAFASLLAAVMQPLLGAWADRPKSPSVKMLLLSATVIFLCCTAGIVFSANGAAALLILFFTLAITVMQGMSPLTNALGMVSARAGHSVNFGIARGVGSLFYALASLAVGSAVTGFGNDLIPLAAIGAYAVFGICLLLFPFQKPDAEERKEKKQGHFFRRYPQFPIVLSAAICLYASHSLINNFMFQVVSSKGGDSGSLGISSAIGALVEIPMMFFFSRFLKRIPAARWMVLSGFAFLVKSFLSLLVPSVYGFYAVQSLQIFAFAVFAVASVYYTDEYMAPGDAVKGQAFLAMTSTIGAVFASAVGGWLIDAFGVSILLGTAVAFSCLGACVLWVGIGKTRGEKIPGV